MTYCLSLLCREGLVFVSDSRTSAGMDNITIHPKLRIYGKPGERILCLMTSGNLSLSQAVIAHVEEETLRAESDPAIPHLLNQISLYETARYLGMKVREVAALDRDALEKDGYNFDVNFLMGGQIIGSSPQIFRVYPQGNAMHADHDSPFLQIGEFKYGKPLLDRGFAYDTSLIEAVKFGVLSLEATMKSNVSVGTPFDVFCYEKDSFEIKYRYRLEEDDPYMLQVRAKWQDGLVRLVRDVPNLVFPGADRQPGAHSQ